ncbi:acyltransferase [Variovorax guangxiensis]|uniref:acyltransferase family protein n=1 Tax=Variovorax guangxiensis TaxID=1775474 RepID=UPI0028678AA1|nr:acyltransferase [Variovorax guangxiensis]MDR6857576.1 peptidoglycan/LPS O-acetylase OafA/YrhL [Variovorax guangxiensis]
MRLARIDHLRAIATLMVLMWHFAGNWPRFKEAPSFPLLSLFREGHTGVSLFCVISGFIFAHLYYDADFKYGDFIRKRLLRIAPLFVLMLVLSFYVSEWDLTSMVMTISTGLSRGGLPSYIGPGWSVLIEFQFYLLFPFLLAFLRRYGAKYLIGVVVLCFAIRCIVYANKGYVQDLAYYSLFGRLDQFMLGMLAAHLSTTSAAAKIFERQPINVGIGLAALASISLFYNWFDAQGGLLSFHGQPWPATTALWIVLPTIEAIFYAIVLVTYLHMAPVPAAHAISRAVAYVGVISYSIYLVHGMVFPMMAKVIKAAGFVPSTWVQSELACLLIAFPAVLVIAALTYHVVEHPFLQLKSRIGTHPPEREAEAI